MDEGTIKKFVDSPPRAAREAFKAAGARLSRLTRSPATFIFRKSEYPYCFSTYNLAWRNERTVEIPIASRYLEAHAGKDILEVGNVLSHYMDVRHDIVDRYEKAEGVVNEDAAEFDPGKRYDAVITVSTLEHVGTYEDPPDPGRAAIAVANLLGLLKPGGELMATAPVGFNAGFDALVYNGDIRFDELYALLRVGPGNRWEEADPESVRGSRYSTKAFRANAIIVGIIRKEDR